MTNTCVPLDCVIFGGGVAGLFTLDACISSGVSTLLLESNALGAGHTIASQGMIRGMYQPYREIHGNKRENSSDVSLMWRRYLAGEASPDLRNVMLRSEYCHLWRTSSFGSMIRWFGIPISTRLHLKTLDEGQRPAIFNGCTGRVTRFDGQVIEPRSLLETLGQAHAMHVLQTTEGGVEVSRRGESWLIRLLNPETGEPLDLMPKIIVLTSGIGNAALRGMFGLSSWKEITPTFRMVLIRGDLPIVNGLCFDGMRCPTVITTTTDYARRRVWQVYSRFARIQSHTTNEQLIRRTVSLLHEILPSLDVSNMEFSAYETSYLEHHAHGTRWRNTSIHEEGTILTCDAVDVAFAPKLASKIIDHVNQKLGNTHTTDTANPLNDSNRSRDVLKAVVSWPRPPVAFPPWEADNPWISLTDH